MSDADKTIIGDDVEIVGSVKSSANIYINGKLNGDLTCSGDAILGSSASIKGNLTVNSITIEGMLNGNVSAKDLVEIKSTARITGDVRAKRMTVEDGVSFVGKAEVTPSGRGGTDQKSIQEIAPTEDDIPSDSEKEGKGGKMFGKK